MQNLPAAAGVEGRDLLQGGEGHLVGRGVGEPDVVELDRHGPLGDVSRVRLLGDQRLQVEDLEDPLEADERAHHLDAGAGEGGQRRVQAGQQQREGDDGTGVEGAAQRQVTAEAVDEREGQRGHHRQRGDEHVLHHRGADADVADAAGPRGELGGLVRGPPEQLDQGRAGGGEPLGHLRAHRRVVRDGLAFEAGEAGAHPAGGQQEQRQQHQREQGDLPRDADHHPERQHDHHQVADDARQGVAERALRADHVVVEAADERAGAGAGEERDRHPLDVVEHRGAQVEDEALADAGRQPPVGEPEPALGDRQHGDQHGEPHHGGRGRALADRVHDPSREHGRRDGQHREDHAEQQERGEGAAVGAGERDDAAQRRPVEGSAVLCVGRVVQRHPRGAFHVHASSPFSEMLRCGPSSNLK